MNHSQPNAFEELRYGYFDVAFGNILKSLRAGVNPIGIMTLAVCSLSAWAELDWSIQNQDQLEDSGELKHLTQSQKKALQYSDKEVFMNWLQRYIQQQNMNTACDSERMYGVRCALVHTGGASASLNKTGVRAWAITCGHPENHYKLIQGDVARFNIEMPLFVAELIIGADRFLQIRKDDLEAASDGLRGCIASLGIKTATDPNGNPNRRLINNDRCLAWFDDRLTETPLAISVETLADKIQKEYDNAVKQGLVLQ
jgi:hypothetical protein